METHSHCGLETVGDFRGICNGISIVNLLPVCWWDSQLLLGSDLPAGDPEPFHRHQTRALCPFPDRATTSLSGTWRACHDPFTESCLRADSEAEQSCLSQPLPKIIFQTRYYHGCVGTRSHCALAAVADVCCDTKYPCLPGCPRWLQEPAPVPLQGWPEISLILVSDPAVLFTFQWSSLLQYLYNSSPSNL